MKTAAVITSLTRNSGGLFQSVRLLHQAIAQLPDTEVTVLGVLDEFAEEDVPKWLPLKVEGFKMRWKQLGYAPGLRGCLLKLQPDLVHSHGVWEYRSVAVSAWHRKYRRPYLVSPHGMLDAWAVNNAAWKKRLAWTFYEREHLTNAGCIRALCEPEANSIRQLGLTNPICVIPNGVNLLPEIENRPLLAESSPMKSFARGRKILLYLGRIHPKKGLVNLLQAWKKALDLQPTIADSWILVIAGWDQGGHEAELKKLATEIGISWGSGVFRDANGNSLLFLGPQFDADKTACYRDCDAFILPSFSEGLPMVVLEAWTYGKPVVMTRECNLPEGFVAQAAVRIEPTIDSISKGLGRLFEMSDEERHTMGRRGLALIKERFTWPKIASTMRQVYAWVLGGGPKPDCVSTP